MPHFSHKRLNGSRSSSRSSSKSRHSRNSSEFNCREEPAREHHHHHHQRYLSVPHADQSQFPPFPPKKSMEDDLSHIHLIHLKNSDASTSSSGSEFSLSSASSSSSSLSLGEDTKSSTKVKLKQTAAKAMPKMKAKLGSVGPHSLNLHTAQQRQAYFHKAKHRKEVVFGPHVRSQNQSLMIVAAVIADSGKHRTFSQWISAMGSSNSTRISLCVYQAAYHST
jgi:hypothetical protein